MHYHIRKREHRGPYYYIEVEFWESHEDVIAGKPPRVINDFNIQLLSEHQRIQTGPSGYLHVSGAEVAAKDVESFLASSDAIQWSRDENGQIEKNPHGLWIRLGGPPVTPFLLRTTEFDPQWQRLRYMVSVDQQIDDVLRRYWNIVLENGWSGDRRGTTLSLQVGASGDDGYSDPTGVHFNASAQLKLGNHTNTGEDCYYRFTGATLVSSAIINSAKVSLWGTSSGATLKTRIYANRAASPVAPINRPEHAGKLKTTAFTQWDAMGLSSIAFTDSPDCKTVIQEIANDFFVTNILILHEDDGSSASYSLIDSYDADTSHAPKLIIDLTSDESRKAVLFRQGSRRRRPIFDR